MEQKYISPDKEEDDIDFVAIAKTIWEGRKTIIKSVIVFIVIGLFIAIFTPKEFAASSVFVPNISDNKSGGSLSGLAAMAGINLGSMGQSAEISPAIYPLILESTSFCKDLMASEITISEESNPISIYKYFIEVKKPSVIGIIKKYTVGLPSTIKKAILSNKTNGTSSELKNAEIKILSEEEYKIKKIIEDIVKVSVEDQSGYVTISAKMPEALAAAQVVKNTQDLLQEYVTNYKISNAQKNLGFIEQRFLEKEKEFYQVQNEVAKYTDQNKNVTSATIKAQYERLSSDYQLKFNVYNELAKQLEQAKIKVTEDTPSFGVIQQVTVPNEKSGTRAIYIIAVFAFLGGVVGSGIIYGKYLYVNFKEKWNN